VAGRDGFQVGEHKFALAAFDDVFGGAQGLVGAKTSPDQPLIISVTTEIGPPPVVAGVEPGPLRCRQIDGDRWCPAGPGRPSWCPAWAGGWLVGGF
jgi:hypothetical protein